MCFDVAGNINTVYACDNYQLILKYVRFFGYNPQELFYGMSTKPDSIISAIDTLTQVWYPKIIFSIFFAALSFKPIVFQQKYVSEIPEIEL